MAAESKSNPKTSDVVNNNGKGKKRKYLPHGKPVRKGSYPLRPGVVGFFLTCDGGRERQATKEALSLLDTFYEEIVHGKKSNDKERNDIDKVGNDSVKRVNKIIKFKDSDDEDETSLQENLVDGDNPGSAQADALDRLSDDHDALQCAHEAEEKDGETDQTNSKKPRKDGSPHPDSTITKSSCDKSIDDLIDEELHELGDRKKRHFVSLESGCNGVVFIQMHQVAGDPGPVEIVQLMMSSVASTRKHMSRFILRILPAEVTCYASEEEITRAIKPLIEQYFPAEASIAYKFAVLYESRSNTGIDRMKIINTVAKSVPAPHKVDLNSPDKTIIVQIVKTICLVGVVERYKELQKYNLRQLTSPPQQ